MHLPERGRSRCLFLEGRKALLPARSKLRPHPPLDKRPAHGRCGRLELGKLGRKLGGHHVRHSREHLRDFHDRPLEAAECHFQFARKPRIGLIAAKELRTRRARGKSADTCPYLCIALQTAAKPVRLAVASTIPGSAVFPRSARAVAHSIASSSSINRPMRERPRSQKAGSLASRPKGARSSLWRSVPPA